MSDDQRDAIVNGLKNDVGVFVLVGSVISSINGQGCVQHTYKSICHKLEKATLPCKIEFLFEMDPQDLYNDCNTSNTSTNSSKNNNNNHFPNTHNVANMAPHDDNCSLSWLCDDLISELNCTIF